MKTTLTFLSLLLSTSTFAFTQADLEKARVMDLPFGETPMENVIELDSNKSFPSENAVAKNPINGRWYDETFVGETFKVRGSGNVIYDYEYWRYVTVYDVNKVKERVSYLPYFEESCFESGYRMATWREQRTLNVSFKSEINGQVLGLGASISTSIEQGVSFTFERGIQAQANIRARHTPYKVSDTLKGVTFIQTYDEDTGAIGYLRLPDWWQVSGQSYPYNFSIDNQNIGFVVERQVLERCNGLESGESGTDDQNYM